MLDWPKPASLNEYHRLSGLWSLIILIYHPREAGPAPLITSLDTYLLLHNGRGAKIRLSHTIIIPITATIVDFRHCNTGGGVAIENGM